MTHPDGSGRPAGAGPRRGWTGLPLAALLLPALLAPAAVAIAAAAGGPILLPVLATIVVYPGMACLLLLGRRGTAVVAVVLWAASLSASVIRVSAADPDALAPVIAGGAAYRAEMFDFVRTGEGREADPLRFIPQHALHLVLFCLLTVVSGGLLGLALGAILVGYMSFYVGALAAAGGSPVVAYLLGWPPWAVARVVAFVLLGVLLSEPLLRAAAGRLGRALPDRVSPRRVVMVAAVLLVADLLLKAVLARPWAGLLRRCLPGS